MTPIFFILCILYSGGSEEDCSFDWQITNDFESDSLHGLIEYENRIVKGDSVKEISHEVRHAVCYLEWAKSNYNTDVQKCNNDLDYYNTYGRYVSTPIEY